MKTPYREANKLVFPSENEAIVALQLINAEARETEQSPQTFGAAWSKHGKAKVHLQGAVEDAREAT